MRCGVPRHPVPTFSAETIAACILCCRWKSRAFQELVESLGGHTRLASELVPRKNGLLWEQICCRCAHGDCEIINRRHSCAQLGTACARGNGSPLAGTAAYLQASHHWPACPAFIACLLTLGPWAGAACRRCRRRCQQKSPPRDIPCSHYFCVQTMPPIRHPCWQLSMARLPAMLPRS